MKKKASRSLRAGTRARCSRFGTSSLSSCTALGARLSLKLLSLSLSPFLLPSSRPELVHTVKRATDFRNQVLGCDTVPSYSSSCSFFLLSVFPSSRSCRFSMPVPLISARGPNVVHPSILRFEFIIMLVFSSFFFSLSSGSRQCSQLYNGASEIRGL